MLYWLKKFCVARKIHLCRTKIRVKKFIERENLLSINKSGFRANDICINQLIPITHEIYRAFNCNPSLEVKGIFLDLSKAFDKVWHQGLLLQLESFRIRRKLLNLLKTIFLTGSKGYY